MCVRVCVVKINSVRFSSLYVQLGGGGGGGGVLGIYPSQNMEGIKKHRKTCILNLYTKSNPPVQYP